MDKYKKQIVVAFIIVVVLFVLSIYIISSLREPSEEKKLTVNYDSSNRVVIYNTLPISDTLGKKIEKSDKKQGYVTLTIKNDNNEDVDYQVYITKLNPEENHINDNYVKFYLADEDNNSLAGFDKNLIPSYDSLLYLNDKPSSKSLYKGKIEANSTKKIVLRVWISDSYAINQSEESFAFSIGVRGK